MLIYMEKRNRSFLPLFSPQCITASHICFLEICTLLYFPNVSECLQIFFLNEIFPKPYHDLVLFGPSYHCSLFWNPLFLLWFSLLCFNNPTIPLLWVFLRCPMQLASSLPWNVPTFFKVWKYEEDWLILTVKYIQKAISFDCSSILASWWSWT